MTNKRVADRIEGPIDYSGPESQFTVRTPEGPGSYGKRAPVQIDRRSPQLRNPETPGFVKKDNSSIVEGVVSQGGELIVTGGSEVRSVDQSGRPSVKGVIIGRGKVQVSGGARVLGRSVYLSGDVVIKGPKALVKDSPHITGSVDILDGQVTGSANVIDRVTVKNGGVITLTAEVMGDAVIDGGVVTGGAKVAGKALIGKGGKVMGEALVRGKVIIKDGAQVRDNAIVGGDAILTGKTIAGRGVVILGGIWHDAGVIPPGKWNGPDDLDTRNRPAGGTWGYHHKVQQSPDSAKTQKTVREIPNTMTYRNDRVRMASEEVPVGSLRSAVIRLAHQKPELRPILLPLLVKKACGHMGCGDCEDCANASFGDPNDPMWQVGSEDAMLAGRKWDGDRSGPDDNVPYNKHPDSPPAGTDGSAARKKYNQWYQENVCEARPDNCGRPEPKKRR